MRRIGETVGRFWSPNTCQHGDRVFHFSEDERKLVVTECSLGDRVETARTVIDMVCIPGADNCIACCSFNDDILVFAGKKNQVFAGFIKTPKVKQPGHPIRLERFLVQMDADCPPQPFLCQVTETAALLYFYRQSKMWICQITSGPLPTMLVQTLIEKLPSWRGFNAVPICLPDRRVLAPGPLSSSGLSIFATRGGPPFLKLGEVPGVAREATSLILVGTRFVVGFGGWNGSPLAELCVFDLQTQKGSCVKRGGDWHPPDWAVPLAVWQNTLYLIGGWNCTSIYSIRLAVLADLIEDEDVRSAFRASQHLGESRLPLCVRDPDPDLGRGMTELGGCFLEYRAYNTVRVGERVFHFSQSEEKLVVTELTFGERVVTKDAYLGIDCRCSDEASMSCCLMGGKILVVSGKQASPLIFAALVSIAPGELECRTVRLEHLRMRGLSSYPSAPYLVPLSESRGWAGFSNSDDVWMFEIRNSELIFKRSTTRLPASEGFGVAPIRLPSGKWLAAGEWPISPDITLISYGKKLSFETIGKIPGAGRCFVTSILLGERFVAGFGGWDGRDSNDLWIFDLETRKSFPVKTQGDWHAPTSWALLEVHNGVLYILGGDTTAYGHSIPLLSVAALIDDEETAMALRLSLGYNIFPMKPSVAELASYIAGLNEELSSLRGQVASLQRDKERLQRESEQVITPPGYILVPFPHRDIPVVSFPQKWKLDSAGLKKCDIIVEEQRKGLPKRQSFLREYSETFGPFLDEQSQRLLFSVPAAVLATGLSVDCVAQVAASLVPGQIFPRKTRINTLARLPTLRPAAKLEDSEGMGKRALARIQRTAGREVWQHTPLPYKLASALSVSRDALETEAANMVSTKLRRVVQAARTVECAGAATEIADVVRFLKEAARAQGSGYEGLEGQGLGS